MASDGLYVCLCEIKSLKGPTRPSCSHTRQEGQWWGCRQAAGYQTTLAFLKPVGRTGSSQYGFVMDFFHLFFFLLLSFFFFSLSFARTFSQLGKKWNSHFSADWLVHKWQLSKKSLYHWCSWKTGRRFSSENEPAQLKLPLGLMTTLFPSWHKASFIKLLQHQLIFQTLPSRAFPMDFSQSQVLGHAFAASRGSPRTCTLPPMGNAGLVFLWSKAFRGLWKEMTQLVKCLHCKHEDLSLKFQQPRKSLA